MLIEYVHSGQVPRLPTAILSATLMLAAMLSLESGLILDNVTRGRQETRRFAYLGVGSKPVEEH